MRLAALSISTGKGVTIAAASRANRALESAYRGVMLPYGCEMFDDRAEMLAHGCERSMYRAVMFPYECEMFDDGAEMSAYGYEMSMYRAEMSPYGHTQLASRAGQPVLGQTSASLAGSFACAAFASSEFDLVYAGPLLSNAAAPENVRGKRAA